MQQEIIATTKAYTVATLEKSRPFRVLQEIATATA